MEILNLITKEIDVLNSEVLFDTYISEENINSLFEFHNSDWKFQDEWLTGINHKETAGMAIFKQDFPGNILVEFEGRTVPPSSHDIDFMWNGEWDEVLNSCGTAYIGGIAGWWSGRVGIEKSPEYKLRATTQEFSLEPGRTYKIQAGSINGNCFIFIDGKLILELQDPEPIDQNKFQKIGFTVWSSHIQIKDIIIRRIRWSPLNLKYTKEF